MSATSQQASAALSADITRMLQAAGNGDTSASDALFGRVYDELRNIAGQQMRGERRDHTLGATALVHEVYVRLLGAAPLHVRDRAGFFRAAAEAMRRILIEHARQRGRQKRGGQRRRIALDMAHLADETQFDEILAVDEAVRRLQEQDAPAAEVVRLRFFAGLSVEETAEVLESSPRTVARDWAYARAWLFRALAEPDD
jgi:RNA polymerase sigma factor (TIGR02999 family)